MANEFERFGSGQAVRRLEDEQLLAGAGRFTDDVNEARQARLVFVRSPYPHARVVAVDTAAARAMPGVLGVFTGADLVAAAVRRIEAAGLRAGTAENMKRQLHLATKPGEWFDNSRFEAPGLLGRLLEMKTLWHPSAY